MIIHHYSTGAIKTTFSSKLNEQQQQVADNNVVFSEKIGESDALPGDYSFNNGGYTSEPFKKGVVKRSIKSFDMTPEFGGKKVTSGVLFSGNKALAGYYAAPGNIPQAGQLGSDLKKFVAGLTAAINKTDDIKSLTISINQTLGIGVSKAGEDIMRAQLNIVMQNVVSELKSNGLNKDIKIQMGEVNIERTEKPAAKNGGVNIKTK